MIRKLLVKFLNDFSYKISGMGYSELNKLRIKGVAKPSYIGPAFMNNKQYIKHIRSLPPKLAIITIAFFITNKIHSRLQHG